MDTIKEEHWRDVAEECDYKKKIHALRWELYVNEREYSIKRYFWFQFRILKEEGMFGLLRSIISSMKRRTTNMLDYVGLVVHYSRKRMVGGIERY